MDSSQQHLHQVERRSVARSRSCAVAQVASSGSKTGQWNLERPVTLISWAWDEKEDFCGNQWGTDFYVFDNYQHISCYRSLLWDEWDIHRGINHQVSAIPMRGQGRNALQMSFIMRHCRSLVKSWNSKILPGLPTTVEGVRTAAVMMMMMRWWPSSNWWTVAALLHCRSLF